jgi:hypothetical protein
MKFKEPMKEILIATRPFWDHPGTRSSVRENFQRMIDCRTSVLGAEIYASARGGVGVLPHLQVQSLPKLRSSSHAAVAEGAILRGFGVTWRVA